MYAVIEDRGTQIKVTPGDVFDIDVMSDAENGQQPSALTFEQVLLVSDEGGSVQIGTPYLAGVSVAAEVIEQVKGDKTVAIMYKRRKGQRKKSGHRQPYLRVKISSINA